MMIVRLFYLPVAIAFATAVAPAFLLKQLSSSSLLSGALPNLLAMANVAVPFILMLMFCWCLRNTYRLWQWNEGNGKDCFYCGGMVVDSWTRPDQCLKCGKTD